jgi:AraC-like DNA-binding protein
VPGLAERVRLGRLIERERAGDDWAELARGYQVRDRGHPGVVGLDQQDLGPEAKPGRLRYHLWLQRQRGDQQPAAAQGAQRPGRDGGQAQYIQQPVPALPESSTSATRQWALDNLHLPLTLADMAGHAQMSLRTFTRRFREETGGSPGQWITRQRVSRARELLEATDLTVDQIAGRSGFATAISLRQHMHAAVGVAPLAYRRTLHAAAGG